VLEKILNFIGFKFPFFKKSVTKHDYLDIFEKIINLHYPQIEKYENESGFSISKSWIDELALHTQVVKKESKINYQHGKVLYSTLRKYLSENFFEEINIFESGTAKGFSSICMSKALIDSNQKGTIHTTDIIPHLKKMYWNIIDDHTRGKLTRLQLLEKWNKELKNIKFYTMKSSKFFKKNNIKRINFAFLDAVHDSLNISEEFEYIKNRQIKGDVIIFDDFDDQYQSLKNFIIDTVPNLYEYQILQSDINRHYFIAKKK
jgi:predicted O-methyltransferase YrrM